MILLCLAWELWLAPTGRGTLAVKALPLLAAPLGLWRYRLYTYRWLALAIWLYVLEGLVRSTSESGPGQWLALGPDSGMMMQANVKSLNVDQWLALGEVLLGVVIFTACTAQIRQRLAAAKA